MESIKMEERRSPPLRPPKKLCFGLPARTCSSLGCGCMKDFSEASKVPQTTHAKKKKSVSFNDEMLAEVIEFEDDAESKNSRKLYWEFMALDRFRFKDRIERAESVLSPVLTKTHRSIMYHQRVLVMGNPLLPVSSPVSKSD